MSRYLYPRLSIDRCNELIAEVSSASISNLVAADSSRLANAGDSYASTGGTRVPNERLRELQQQVRKIAARHGYPGPRTLRGQQDFEVETSIFLHDELDAVPGELQRYEVWRFLACVLVPDVVVWRWTNKGEGTISASRFEGGNRNALGRLWLRAKVFKDPGEEDPWGLLRYLSEDNFTAILERSAFARVHKACREVARALREREAVMINSSVESPRQTLLRRAMMRLVRLGAFVSFASMEEKELAALASRAFDDTLVTLGLAPRALPFAAEPVTVWPERVDDDAPLPVESTQPSEAPAGVGIITSAALDDLDVAGFMEADLRERARLVWESALGVGELPEVEMIRKVAQDLRDRGLVEYQRLREGGLLYTAIHEAMEWGRKKGMFDIPTRGHRRAICWDLNVVPDRFLARCIVDVVSELREVAEQNMVAVAMKRIRPLFVGSPDPSYRERLRRILDQLLISSVLVSDAGWIVVSARSEG